jgi:outer membrane protein TolC
MLILGAAVWLSGCNAPRVSRSAEVQRLKEELSARAQSVTTRPSRILTMDECVDVALANSLDLSVRKLALSIQDESVRLALSGAMPKITAQYGESTRSNDSLQVNPDGSVARVGDRRHQAATVGATLPLLDWGLTYYSWQIARDQRAQEFLLFHRAVQNLRTSVRVAYARHAGAIRQQRLAALAMQAAGYVLRTARSLEAAQLTVRADTSLVEAAIAQANLELSLANQSVEQTRLILSQLMSLPPGTEFEIIEQLPNLPAPPEPGDVEAMAERALQARPELAVQDLEQHISANGVRRAAAEFFPRVDGLASYNWSGASNAVNSGFFSGGFAVTQSLLDGGASIWRYRIARKGQRVQEEQSLLAALGVLYDVQLRALQVRLNRETVIASEQFETARRAALDRIITLYREGLQDEAGAAQALADLSVQASSLDKALTDYQVAWYELENAVLPEARPTAAAATQPTTQPANPLKLDLRKYGTFIP